MHSGCWRRNLFAGLTPVLALAFLPLDSARWVSLVITLTLLLLLGYGRARIGQRPLWQTMAQTVSIAAAAAADGIVIEEILRQFFLLFEGAAAEMAQASLTRVGSWLDLRIEGNLAVKDNIIVEIVR